MSLNRRDFMKTVGVSTAGALTAATLQARGARAENGDRPNILWLTCEDIGPHLGCYGDEYAHTPNLDAFAEKALRYDVAWSDAPVCAPARTGLITGVYPPSLGGQHMRSMVGMPDFMRMYPQFLRDAGYHCTNNGKEDYNVRKPGDVWHDAGHYEDREEGQPFFAIFNNTQTHESRIRNRTDLPHHDPDEAPIPPYHPDTPEVRRDWAQYYHSISLMDGWFGEQITELEEAGLMEDTIIFFYGDHGSGMPRNKRWPYDSGNHVPLIVYVPEKWRHLAPADYEPGGSTRRPVGFVDMAPTLLSLANTEPPEWMQGRAFMGHYEAEPREYLFGFRGRMDERYDMVRSVRNDRYIYVRNYMPHRIYGQYIGYMFITETTQVWHDLYHEGELEPPQTYFWEEKPAEELYDLENDPHEVNNLVDSEEHQAVLNELRQAHRDHMMATRDAGFLPEAEMHRRAKGSTKPVWELDNGTSIYEMAHDPEQYPLERIMATAELAASRAFEAVPHLLVCLEDGDPAIRYWALTGLLVRGAPAFEMAPEKVRELLDDENASVRIVAAELLGSFGGEEDVEAAVDALGELAPPQDNGAYVGIAAMNVIEKLGDKAERLWPMLEEMDPEDPDAPGRANNYVDRLRP
ncbi:MAG: sulfatase-like hydrolase/transferase [Candidatus Hydrogenedentota bacterium]